MAKISALGSKTNFISLRNNGSSFILTILDLYFMYFKIINIFFYVNRLKLALNATKGDSSFLENNINSSK